MTKRSKIMISFDPQTTEVRIQSVNAPKDRDVLHEAFMRALGKSRFKPDKIQDIGEFEVRPIKTEKELIFESKRKTLLE